MDLSEGADFWEAPLPSDHRRHADGSVDLQGLPNPDEISFIQSLVALTDGQLRGFGTSSTLYFPASGPLAAEALPDVHSSVLEGSPVFLVGIEPGSPDFGRRLPVDVSFTEDGGPFGADHLLSLLPLQGRPMLPDTRYAAVVLRGLGDAAGDPLAAAQLEELPSPYPQALQLLSVMGVHSDEIAGAAVFSTQDPTAGLHQLVSAAREHPPEPLQGFELTDVFDDYCVFRSSVDMPVYQEGEPPFLTVGGGLALDDDGVPVLQGFEEAWLDLTIPRAQAPETGWPVGVFIRTGGGGERPLVDRGAYDAAGELIEEGSGLARTLARAGFAAVSVDGPHGGLRNVTGGDEQFLIFNILNPEAMRDNLRQSAAELTLLPELLAGLDLDVSACPGSAPTQPAFDPAHLALLGHSMGATIAPLVLAAEPAYGAAVLSGAGGSWIQNIVHKLSPLEVRPMAEAMLQYEAGQLSEADPALALLQWAGESADPPVYAWNIGHGDDPRQVLMVQGIVDSYILPPMANAMSLSAGLDLAGPVLDADHAELGAFRPLEELLYLVDGAAVDLPAGGEHTALVVQHAEDGIQDGHEVLFQLPGPRHQLRCFLQGWLQGAPVVPQAGDELDPCAPLSP